MSGRQPVRRDSVQRIRIAVTTVLMSMVLTACGGSEPPRPKPDPVDRVDASRFAAVAKERGTFLLNVHTPDEGSIPGTDAEIPYDQLSERAAELPTDRSTTIAIYCRSDRMSGLAIPTLRRLGYTNVTELAGGMKAWQADGRRLLPPH